MDKSGHRHQIKYIYCYCSEGPHHKITLIPYKPHPRDSKEHMETREKTTLPEARRRHADARALLLKKIDPGAVEVP